MGKQPVFRLPEFFNSRFITDIHEISENVSNLDEMNFQKSVMNSRQFPLRFFSAYVVLDELRVMKTKAGTVSFNHNT